MASFALTRPSFTGFRPGGFGGFPARRSAGTSPALKRTQAALESTRARMRDLRENATGKGAQIEAAVLTVGGGAVSGALKAKLPEVAGIDSRYIAGAVGAGAGLFVVKGKWGGRLLNLAAGVLACAVSDTVEDLLDGDDAE